MSLTPDTKRQLRSTGATVAVIAGALAIGILSIPKPRTVALQWQSANVGTNYETEVWGSTNLASWYFITATTSNRVDLPEDKPAEFFKIRTRARYFGTNFIFSDWARKPTL